MALLDDCTGDNGENFWLINPSSTEGHITVDPDHQYAIHHTGYTDALGSDTAVVVISEAASITASAAAASNKSLIGPGASYVIGPGVETVYLKTNSATASAVNVNKGPAFLNHR